MSLLKAEPFAAVKSMDELLAMAYAMEQEAIAGYSELAERMRREEKLALAAVFERLVAEERQHLGNVSHWSERINGKPPELSTLPRELDTLFDDEGATTVAPELLSAYTAFSMAVRNEERAFLFWTYVASQAPSDDLRRAAEQMAREELGHISTLRRERRHAFHVQRVRPSAAQQGWNLVALERRLSELLEGGATTLHEGRAAEMRDLASDARGRAEGVEAASLGDPPLLKSVTADATDRAAPLCELLLECYLDLADHLSVEADRNLAQTLAANAVHSLSALRR